MNRKRFEAEEFVNKLREVDVLLSGRQVVARGCKHIDLTMDASRDYKCPIGVL